MIFFAYNNTSYYITIILLQLIEPLALTNVIIPVENTGGILILNFPKLARRRLDNQGLHLVQFRGKEARRCN